MAINTSFFASSVISDYDAGYVSGNQDFEKQRAQVFAAIAAGDVAHLTVLLKSVDVLKLGVNADGDSILFAAAKCKDAAVVNAVLAAVRGGDQRAEFTQQATWWGKTALHVAVGWGNYETMMALLDVLSPEQQAQYVQKTAWFSPTALQQALRNLHCDIAQALLDAVLDEQEKEQFAQKNGEWFGLAPLHLAVLSGNISILQELIKCVRKENRSAFIQQTNWYGKTALSQAIGVGRYAAMDELLKELSPDEKKRFVQKTAWFGLTPLQQVLQRARQQARLEVMLLQPTQLELHKVLQRAQQQALQQMPQQALAEKLKKELLSVQVITPASVWQVLQHLSAPARKQALESALCQAWRQVLEQALAQVSQHALPQVSEVTLRQALRQMLLAAPQPEDDFKMVQALLDAVPDGPEKVQFVRKRGGLFSTAPLQMAMKSGHHELVKLLIDSLVQAGSVEIFQEFFQALILALKLQDSLMTAQILYAAPGHVSAQILAHPLAHRLVFPPSHPLNLSVVQFLARSFGIFYTPHAAHVYWADMNALHYAALGNNHLMVTLMLDSVPEGERLELIQKPNFCGITALQFSALSNGSDVALALLHETSQEARNQLILHKSRSCNSALSLAAWRGDQEKVLMFLELIAPEMRFSAIKQSMLLRIVIAAAGNVDNVSQILNAVNESKRYELILQTDESGETPLSLAARLGHEEIVLLLLQALSPLERLCTIRQIAGENQMLLVDKEGQTLLMRAAGKGQLNLVKYLMRSGADPKVTDPQGRDALVHAVNGKRNAVQKYLDDFLVNP